MQYHWGVGTAILNARNRGVSSRRIARTLMPYVEHEISAPRAISLLDAMVPDSASAYAAGVGTQLAWLDHHARANGKAANLVFDALQQFIGQFPPRSRSDVTMAYVNAYTATREALNGRAGATGNGRRRDGSDRPTPVPGDPTDHTPSPAA